MWRVKAPMTTESGIAAIARALIHISTERMRTRKPVRHGRTRKSFTEDNVTKDAA